MLARCVSVRESELDKIDGTWLTEFCVFWFGVKISYGLTCSS